MSKANLYSLLPYFDLRLRPNARLCRIVQVRKGLGCRGAMAIRHTSEFGIVAERVPSDRLQNPNLKRNRPDESPT